ncbi:hypothetical protein BO82DRAFT_58653 [Aspergillus uvarum CBS 121591]|uniref:Uncharacterized protein n=1 Tax=Aspergillus uvarum CBS 121591 TaxID=1448315 RepID=A0A319CBF5_9EURO|nr:hypothetical protein BO82DRAFT_58653 [Aspergillus uvarum CBS 121591]PYH82875.1 hypothetical protein BO82DRAFT_58653 [Aspergillus uvarum CBS 121591]
MGLELVCLVSLCLAGTHHYACRSAVETTITASNHRPSGTGQACHRPYESLCHLNDCILGSKETWHMVRPWVVHTLTPSGNSMEMLRRKEGKRCKANNRLGRITFRAKNLSNVRSTYLGFFPSYTWYSQGKSTNRTWSSTQVGRHAATRKVKSPTPMMAQ